MEFIETAIPDVKLIRPKVFGDERGFFMETWQRQMFADAGIDYDFVQDNHSRSQENILRGLHYQIQQPQGKLVWVTRGTVFDVAVDLRRSSPTFGQWVGEYISEENKYLLWVPPGFAHGFYVVEGPADFQYKCSDYYLPEGECCVRWDDPDLSVEWPLRLRQEPQVSDKDSEGVNFINAPLYD